jgi:hypothetical protein
MLAPPPERSTTLRGNLDARAGIFCGLRESVGLPRAKEGGDVDASGEARAALCGTRYEIVNALAHVPDAPGLYAVYGSRETWDELQLDCESERRSLYVGKAEDSLVSRDLQTHFATGRTGSSTVRRSFAALLRDSLDLRGQPRNSAKPERFANFGLAQSGDRRLTDWMHRHLQLAVWIKPPGVELDRIETDVIRAWRPPLNLAKHPHPLAKLQLARKTMADDARAWAQSNR